MTNKEITQKINQWMACIRVMRPSVEEAGTIALPLAAIVNEMADLRDALLKPDETQGNKADEEA